jgi:hypothetical protein
MVGGSWSDFELKRPSVRDIVDFMPELFSMPIATPSDNSALSDDYLEELAQDFLPLVTQPLNLSDLKSYWLTFCGFHMVQKHPERYDKLAAVIDRWLTMDASCHSRPYLKHLRKLLVDPERYWQTLLDINNQELRSVQPPGALLTKEREKILQKFYETLSARACHPGRR